MSQYKAYPAYKDSGVEWIGQVPEHWQVKRLKHLISQCQNGVWGDDPLEDGSDTLCIRVADFDRDNNVVIYNPSTYRQITKEHQDSRLVSKGDILLEKSGGGAQTLVGANVRYLGEEPAVCSNFVAVIKPSKKAESAWLNYLMESMYALKINLRSIKQSTGIQNLDSEQYLDEGVAAPSLDEQASIAATLDRETARIDALIEKKTRFIELLKEKRQALITHAVTKGLDPNVNMKDSGVEWIGQVPEHWKVARVKRLASLRNERRNDVSTDTIYIGLEDVEAGSGQYKPTNGSSRQSEDSTVGIFYEGDVLYGKLRPYLRKAIISEMAGCCSTEFLVLRAEKTEPKWLQEWLLTPDVTHQIESGCEGAKMPRADWWHIGSIEVVYPDQPEQAQILTTLDRETARIDALIEKKTRFIELLKEKRQALITHAVTKGLDPNVNMKDSGVEWIGQVPEHWDIVQIKRISALNPKKSTLSEEKDSLCTFLPMEKLRTNAVTLDETRPIHEVYGGYSYFCDDDILIAKVTPCFENGNIAVANGLVNGIGFGSTEINVLRVNGKGHNRFLYYRLQEEQFRTIAKSEMRGTGGLKRVPTELFESFTIGLPHTDEQATIAATLDRETARIDALIGKAEHSITLLKERRAAFITAAVTGQIDLRGEQ